MTLSLDRPTTPATETIAEPPFEPEGATWPIELLWEADTAAGGPGRGGRLPAGLARRYGADLRIPLREGRSTVIANFVATLDGVVALDRLGATGGREVSGAFGPDRFVMGLLRATADAVLVGAGTVRASRNGVWTPGRAHPPSAEAYAGWRRDLGLATVPTTVIVTASGKITSGGFHLAGPDTPGIVVTTDRGADQLRGSRRIDGIDVVSVSAGGDVPLDALLELLHERGFSLVLSEAGPTLFGELLGARAVDELFLTLAPQVVGRSEHSPRLGLVEGTALAQARWGGLRSAMRSGDHLFLRYALSETRGPTGART